VAEILAKAPKAPLRLQFSILEVEIDESMVWSVVVDEDGGRAASGPSGQADVEVITQAETWWAMAEGRLSPLDAFLSGRMRVRGNIELAKRIFLVDLAAGSAELPEWLR